ncbi:MAG: response regulator [Dehalococcoidia bacterium]|nr:response regulator [Dehalococcoidia bacterium]
MFRDPVLTSAVLDGLPAHIALIDRSGVLRWTNRAWREFGELNGAHPGFDGGIGTNYVDVCKATDGDERAFALEIAGGLESVLSGRTDRFVTTYPCATETDLLWFRATFTALSHEEFAVLAVHDDVTDQRRIAEQVLESQRSEAVATMLAGVAHDFNNLLTAIGGSLELAESGEDRARWMSQARLATARAGDLVKKLLRVSRRQTSETEQEVELVSIASEIVDLSREVYDRRVEIVFDAPKNASLVVHGDHADLEQVLMNLLNNARDAILARLDGAPAGEPGRIRVTLQPVVKDGDHHARILVEDNGVGMGEETRHRAFDAFFTTKARQQGTGLGLPMAASVIRDLGGDISVASQPGLGTRFTIELPLARPAVSTGPGDSSGRTRVLVVDDEPIVGAVAEAALNARGYATRTARTVDEALTRLSEEPVEIVILDQNMPGSPPTTLIEWLDRADAPTRVIAISGLESRFAQMTSDRVVRFLPKPFGTSDLAEAVREAELAAR